MNNALPGDRFVFARPNTKTTQTIVTRVPNAWLVARTVAVATPGQGDAVTTTFVVVDDPTCVTPPEAFRAKDEELVDG